MYRQRPEFPPHKCFRCGSVDHIISKFPKPPKDNDKRQNKACFNKRNNFAPEKQSENGEDNYYQKIYVSMARLSVNCKSSSRDFGGSYKLTNWILDSGATCHMTPKVSDFRTGALEDTDKYIEVADGH